MPGAPVRRPPPGASGGAGGCRGSLRSRSFVVDRDGRRLGRSVALLHDLARQRVELARATSIDDKPRICVKARRRIRPTTRSCCSSCARARACNVWEWIQASLDPNIDLFKEQQFTGGLDPEEVRVESDADMAQLATRGEEARARSRGLRRCRSARASPCSRCSRRALPPTCCSSGDVLLTVDGKKLERSEVALRCDRDAQGRRHGRARDPARDGTEKTVQGADRGRRRRQAGHRRHRLRPATTSRSTSTSTRAASAVPSAGLAMTLSILDKLTPGDLTGGKKSRSPARSSETDRSARSVASVRRRRARRRPVPSCSSCPRARATTSRPSASAS